MTDGRTNYVILLTELINITKNSSDCESSLFLWRRYVAMARLGTCALRSLLPSRYMCLAVSAVLSLPCCLCLAVSIFLSLPFRLCLAVCALLPLPCFLYRLLSAFLSLPSSLFLVLYALLSPLHLAGAFLFLLCTFADQISQGVSAFWRRAPVKTASVPYCQRRYQHPIAGYCLKWYHHDIITT